MSDLNSIAASFYDHPTSQAVAAEQAPQNSEPAPNVSGEPPRETRSDAEKLDALYSTEAYREVKLVEAKGTLDENPAEIEEANEAHRDSMWALQLSEPEAAEYTSLLKSAQSVTDEDRASWPRQQEEILSGWSHDERRHRLEVVTEWLRRSPTLAQQIIDHKLVGHPRLLKVALEKSWSAKARGEF